MRNARETDRGFTLVEMLVVILIILVLFSLMVGYFSGLRESAKVTACQSNLATIGRAILAYSADNRGFLPGGQPGNEMTNSTALVTSLLPYRHIIPYIVPDADVEQLATAPPPEVFRCPADDKVFGKLWDDGKGYTTSYLYNTVEMTDGTVIDPSSDNGVRYVDPSAHAKPRPRSFFDHQENWKDGINDPAHQEVAIDSTPWEEGQEGTSYRHFKRLGPKGEGSNVLFLDGHVEFVPANPDDIEFEPGFEFFKGADPADPALKDKYWVRWIARKY